MAFSAMNTKTKLLIFQTCLLLFLLSLFPLSVYAVVSLISFTATPGDGQILIQWETATEFDNAGFYVTRSTNEDGTYTRISDFIPSEGLGLTGASYSFQDNNVENGTTYYYILESIDTNQMIEYHGPISATAGVPTPTNTPLPPSPTPTQETGTTQTPTKTQITRTTTPTFTNTPTNTSTPSKQPTLTKKPQHPTATKTNTPTQTVSPTITPSSTLEPMPEIILQFPTPSILTPTQGNKDTLSPPVTNQPDSALSHNILAYFSPIAIVAIVIILWLILMIFLYNHFIRDKTKNNGGQ